MLTQVFASAVFGSDAVPITIELHIGEGDEDINQSVLSFVGEPVAVHGQEYTYNRCSELITSANKIEYK